MSIWRQAEEILKAIQRDLDNVPPDWESASRSTENLKAVIPSFPKFQEPNSTDWRTSILRADLIHLQFGINKRDHAVAALSAASALHNVRELGKAEGHS
jgi:hypothetical protein